MKLYHLKENLSRIYAAILCGDAYGCLYIFGEHLIYGTEITGWLLVPVVLLAVMGVGLLAWAAARMIRKIRAPRRLGVIGAEIIREMEASRWNTKS